MSRSVHAYTYTPTLFIANKEGVKEILIYAKMDVYGKLYNPEFCAPWNERVHTFFFTTSRLAYTF